MVTQSIGMKLSDPAKVSAIIILVAIFVLFHYNMLRSIPIGR